ncbi:MAG: hypothetical protein GC151_15800 [Betaproteobacteria bacterium]|nr:hypothetical protein [Betaproteobacteria bacterium]
MTVVPPPRLPAVPVPRSGRRSRTSRFPAGIALILCSTLLAGCGALRSYRAEMDETLNRAGAGDVAGAIKVIERNNKGDKKDLLYFLELGELERLDNDFKDSFAAYAGADAVVQAWENAARLDPAKAAGQAASYVINDRVRPYEGHDYEKVMLTTRMAMDHLAMGDWDDARVDIKRTHEREAVIAEVRSAEYVRIEEEAKSRGVDPSFKEISGYPVETLETPESLALRNGYQNALSHYLAGFIYESLGEESLAAPGYRNAIELRPDQPVLEQALAALDTHLAAPDDTQCDLLLLIETGTIPGRVSQSFNLPVPIVSYGAIINIPVSFPVLPPDPVGYQPPDVQVDRNTTLPTAHILDLDAMARRALHDEMPAIMLRAFIRSSTKAVAQYEMQKNIAKRQRNREDSVGAVLALFALQVGGIVIEQADERGWRTLPSHVSLARVRLPRGRHTVDVRTTSGTATFDVTLSSRYAIVDVRLLRGQHFVTPVGAPQHDSAASGTLAPLRSAATEPLYARVRTIDLPAPPPPSRRTQK